MDEKRGVINMKKILTLLVVMAMCIMPMAFAAPTGGTVDELAQETGAAAVVQTVDIEGGNVTGVNVSTTSITGRWAGFWGNITGGIELSDSSANKFYEWTVSNMDGAVVYVSNGTVSDFGSLAAATVSDLPSYITGAATDNFSNTFTATEIFNSSSVTNITSTPYAQSWQSGSQGTLKTYALKDTDGDLVWAGKAQNDVTGFNGETLDYQILVPADSTVVTYSFYLELP